MVISPDSTIIKQHQVCLYKKSLKIPKG